MIFYFYYRVIMHLKDIIFKYYIMNCKISIYLAYAMASYILGSVYYLIVTRYVGTPFKDSLTKKQLLIKKKSANVRRNIFYQGIIISTIVLIVTKPFNKC